MVELWLKFKDEKGDEQRVLVEGDAFTVGRHSASDLSIPDGRLSREHVRINRFGDVFVLSDLGSSNGTKHNEAPLSEPIGLKNGDKLDLGGVPFEVEIVSDEANGASPPQPEASAPEAPITPTAAAAAAPSGGGGIPTAALVIAPIFALIVLVFVGGLIYALSGPGKGNPSSGNDFVYSTDSDNDDDDDDDNDPVDNGNKKSNGGRESNSLTSTNDSPGDTGGTSTTGTVSTNTGSTTPPANLSETAKIEQNGAAFLRNIAQNDSKAFLTSEQAKEISPKIKQVSSSTAVAANISSAKKNSSQIRSIAAGKNLKPQFLAVAAITKLGNSRGDVVQTAQAMADILDKLGIHIGSESSEDTLLLIAAYDQGVAGDFMKMRNMLQDLANKFPESPRTIRTIWFLKKQGKISNAEFDRAITFLAIGTVAQNPKDFGSSAEALSL
jgi:hypothetical protein